MCGQVNYPLTAVSVWVLTTDEPQTLKKGENIDCKMNKSLHVTDF